MSEKEIKPNLEFTEKCSELFTSLLGEALNSDGYEEKIEAFFQVAAACCQLIMERNGETSREFKDVNMTFVLQILPSELLQQITKHLEGIHHDNETTH